MAAPVTDLEDFSGNKKFGNKKTADNSREKKIRFPCYWKTNLYCDSIVNK